MPDHCKFAPVEIGGPGGPKLPAIILRYSGEDRLMPSSLFNDLSGITLTALRRNRPERIDLRLVMSFGKPENREKCIYMQCQVTIPTRAVTQLFTAIEEKAGFAFMVSTDYYEGIVIIDAVTHTALVNRVDFRNTH